jgi:type IV secretion system protein VirB5
MRKALLATATAMAFTSIPSAHASGIPVVDVAAIAQLMQQITYWQQQIGAMANQLNQLQQTYAAMTGDRGMAQVLPATTAERNYLPNDYAELMATVNGNSASYSGLAGQVQAALQANAVLSNTQMASLSPETRALVEQGRQSAAMVDVMSRAAYEHTSQRFAALQQLISMISYAHDQKAAADLQVRVNAEQAMLANEQSKLQALAQVEQAAQANERQRTREQVIAGHGEFSARFIPKY